MLFSNSIRTLRENRRVPQRELANALGIDVPLYSRIERGERPVKREQISVIAKVLNADEQELLKLWLADQVSAVLGSVSEIANEVIDIAKSDINKMATSKTKKKKASSSNALKGIDLFCGIGGFRLAMQDNNVECVFSKGVKTKCVKC